MLGWCGALILLLLGFLGYRVQAPPPGCRRKRLPGKPPPKDSFFAASGGESVDTKNRSVVSSLSYSPSQLDAGDVDPVAEADVYLAYGRDLQAEEILREALRINPERIGHPPQAARNPRQAPRPACLRGLASDVHKLTGGQGNDWNRVVEMGKELDPGNPLYEAGVRPVGGDSVLPATAAIAATAVSAVVAAPAGAAPVAAPPPGLRARRWPARLRSRPERPAPGHDDATAGADHRTGPRERQPAPDPDACAGTLRCDLPRHGAHTRR
jgi:pilus assembly protein FimV